MADATIRSVIADFVDDDNYANLILKRIEDAGYDVVEKMTPMKVAEKLIDNPPGTHFTDERRFVDNLISLWSDYGFEVVSKGSSKYSSPARGEDKKRIEGLIDAVMPILYAADLLSPHTGGRWTVGPHAVLAPPRRYPGQAPPGAHARGGQSGYRISPSGLPYLQKLWRSASRGSRSPG